MTIVSQPTMLPQLTAPVFIADGGLETTLIFHEGLDLPDFAAFPLLDHDIGRAALRRYYESYLDIAQRRDVGIVLDTPTWRANADWGQRLGYDRDQLAAVNEQSVEFVRSLAAAWSEVTAVLNGVIGPRGDGYVVGEQMTADEATSYHALQARAFAAAGADLITSVTLTYVDEAIGVARAARDAGLPVAIGFTVETDGRLPSGTTIGDAIAQIDEATDAPPAYYMINCAHPSHFDHVLEEGGDWLHRIKAVRANASRMSHAELDEADELDRGDPSELTADYRRLRELLPDLRVVGGCCGTDHHHIDVITAELTS
jgi:S-methylmethionine-dependent homocysteine/selenocysteine methylase